MQQTSAQELLARYGKSFHWAGQLMHRDTLRDAAILYAFCREADDAVDLAASPASAWRALAQIRLALRRGSGYSPATDGYIQLARQHHLSPGWACDLLDGIGSDVGDVQIRDQHQLLQYCYRVAGTVGAMMCPLLAVSDARARPFAIDLGIAMQLTNIARDVLEDAGRNRLYVPQSFLPGPVSAEALVRGDTSQRQMTETAILRLLDLADTYYQSADRGMRFIPLRNRLAIVTAARLYRAIGEKIRHEPEQIWYRRVVVSPLHKALHTLGAGIETLSRPSLLGFGQPGVHQPQLHAALAGLLPDSRYHDCCR